MSTAREILTPLAAVLGGPAAVIGFIVLTRDREPVMVPASSMYQTPPFLPLSSDFYGSTHWKGPIQPHTLHCAPKRWTRWDAFVVDEASDMRDDIPDAVAEITEVSVERDHNYHRCVKVGRVQRLEDSVLWRNWRFLEAAFEANKECFEYIPRDCMWDDFLLHRFVSDPELFLSLRDPAVHDAKLLIRANPLYAMQYIPEDFLTEEVYLYALANGAVGLSDVPRRMRTQEMKDAANLAHVERKAVLRQLQVNKKRIKEGLPPIAFSFHWDTYMCE
jgi:hypothetical protein